MYSYLYFYLNFLKLFVVSAIHNLYFYRLEADKFYMNILLILVLSYLDNQESRHTVSKCNSSLRL